MKKEEFLEKLKQALREAGFNEAYGSRRLEDDIISICEEIIDSRIAL